MTRHGHLSLIDNLFRDPYQAAADELLAEYLAKIPSATDAIGEADNVAIAHGFTIHQLEPDEHGLPPRLYVHHETSAALFWVAGIPTSQQAEFGRAMFLAGVAWGAGTAVDLYSLMRLHVATGGVKHETSATVTKWLQHHRTFACGRK